MTCYSPRPANQDDEPNLNGKRPLIFSILGSQRDAKYQIPCGKCNGCKADSAQDWGVRIFHESMVHERSAMLTLTYDNDHLPIDGNLDKKHVQDFMKRLRKLYKVRYVATGEYGDKTKRPHYHVALFGEDFMGGGTRPDTNGMYSNPELDRVWSMGAATAIPITPASAFYVAGYVNKKIGDPDTFALQSRKPPIGRPWLDRNFHLLPARGTVMVGGRERPIPKKYLEWYPEELDHIKANRRPINRDLIELSNLEKNREHIKQLLQEEKI